MTTTKKVVQIRQATAQTPLSPAQKKFNNLIKKIDAQKKLLADWQSNLSAARQILADKLMPLRDTLSEHQIEMVKLLDQQFLTQKFTTKQQEKIAYLICRMAEEVLSLRDDAELKALYNRYTEGDYDADAAAEEAIASEMMKAMFEQEFGVSLADDEVDMSDPQGTAERLFAKLQQQQTAEQVATEQARPARKKSAKQLAKEAKAAEEAAQVSKSIQAVYRQLTSVLHPDREPDPVERERKTELMQQVTVAYTNKDLLKLLELQLAVEQIDPAKLATIAEDRLKHYNKVLTQQLRELEDEVFTQKEHIRMMLRLPPFAPLSPKRLLSLAKEDVATVQMEIARIQHDLRGFRDVKYLKAWLKDFDLPEPDPFPAW